MAGFGCPPRAKTSSDLFVLSEAAFFDVVESMLDDTFLTGNAGACWGYT
jgi:hypothetical protein